MIFTVSRFNPRAVCLFSNERNQLRIHVDAFLVIRVGRVQYETFGLEIIRPNVQHLFDDAYQNIVDLPFVWLSVRIECTQRYHTRVRFAMVHFCCGQPNRVSKVLWYSIDDESCDIYPFLCSAEKTILKVPFPNGDDFRNTLHVN